MSFAIARAVLGSIMLMDKTYKKLREKLSLYKGGNHMAALDTPTHPMGEIPVVEWKSFQKGPIAPEPQFFSNSTPSANIFSTIISSPWLIPSTQLGRIYGR
jgi:hypothetical protein